MIDMDWPLMIIGAVIGVCVVVVGVYGLWLFWIENLWPFLKGLCEDFEEVYWVGRLWAMGIIFIGAWIYCIVAYGFLMGVGLGWLPAGITAFVLSFLWPLFVLALLAGALLAGLNWLRWVA